MPTYRSLSTMSVLLGKFRHGPAGFPAPHSCLETISNIILHPPHPDTHRPREYESSDLYVSRGVIFIKITSSVQRSSRMLGERERKRVFALLRRSPADRLKKGSTPSPSPPLGKFLFIKFPAGEKTRENIGRRRNGRK